MLARIVRACILIGASALMSACAREPAVPPTPTNLLIVTIDTLRADRLGVYGATNVSTPHIDRLAREGAWAPQAAVHAPLTRPSHASLFTGLYPAEHGIRDNISPPLPANVPVLATLFERDKFATAAFVASAVLDRQSGLARGFSLYGDRFDQNADRRSGDLVVGDAIAWLKGKSRFFAWVHLYDPHAPYEPPSPFKEQYAGRPYDGTVAWSDELVGRLISALRESNALDNTLVVVTSDHGEALGEHGEDVHGYFIYEATLRVPLVVRGPGINAGTRLAGVARTIDLYPTIVEMFGLGDEHKSSGKSLAAALRSAGSAGSAGPADSAGGGRMHDEPSFAESLVPLLHYGWSDLRSVRDGRWKYILAPRPELYDLDRDPGELHNLIDAEPARARAMNAGIKARLQTEQKAVRTEPGRVPPELMEKLGALGYVSPRGSNAKASGADPKDTLEEYKAITASMQQALVAFRSGRPADAVNHLQPLVKRGFDSYELHYYLGRSYDALGRPRDAASSYERAAALFPRDATVWRHLGETRVVLRDWPRAAQAFEQLVEIVPEDALARMELGQVYRDQGRWNAAAAAMRAAVDRDASRADFWNALGTAYGGGGRMAEAERAFAEAATRDPGDARFRYNHALALQQLGRRDEALAELRAAAQLGSADARALLGMR